MSSQLKAFIERFYCLAEEDSNPPLGRYEIDPVKDCALLMTSADEFFWIFEQAVSYYQFALVNYIGFRDMGMILDILRKRMNLERKYIPPECDMSMQDARVSGYWEGYECATIIL